jgi:hypothetical protein
MLRLLKTLCFSALESPIQTCGVTYQEIDRVFLGPPLPLFIAPNSYRINMVPKLAKHVLNWRRGQPPDPTPGEALGHAYGIIVPTKSRFRRLDMRQIPSLDGPRKASWRLSGLVWRPAGRRAKGLRRIESP